jgi:uncharacterized protein (DUF1697 family)
VVVVVVVVVKIRGSVADQARAAVLFLQGHGQPTATLAGYVEDAIRERLERDRAELNQARTSRPVTDHLRPGRRIGRSRTCPQWFPSCAHAMKAGAAIKREASGMTKVYLALLRGINVGGKNKVPMAELKACFEELGCENVRTYIASGNVMFESNKSSAELTEEIQEALPAKFRLDSALIRILVLSRDQLQRVIDQAPKGFGTEPGKYHSDAIFLMGIPSDEAIKIFNPREGVDKVWQGDLAIYSQRLSAQRTRSRLSKIMSSPLYKQMTIRSWDTTARLLELMNAVER